MKFVIIFQLIKLIVVTYVWFISRRELRENKISEETYWLKMMCLLMLLFAK